METLYTLSVLLPRFLKPGLGSVKGRHSQVTAAIHNQKPAGETLQPTPVGARKLTKVTDCRGEYYNLFGNGKSWYGISCLSVWEASSVKDILSPWLQLHSPEGEDS